MYFPVFLEELYLLIPYALAVYFILLSVILINNFLIYSNCKINKFKQAYCLFFVNSLIILSLFLLTWIDVIFIDVSNLYDNNYYLMANYIMPNIGILSAISFIFGLLIIYRFKKQEPLARERESSENE